jgi:hypothetical protein
VRHFLNYRDLEDSYGVTWCQLVDLEPMLEELLWSARRVGVACCKWSDVERVFAPLRHCLVDLIGFRGRHHRDPVLGSVGAYEVAHWRLYDAARGLLPLPGQGQPAEAPGRHNIGQTVKVEQALAPAGGRRTVEAATR